MLVCFVSSPVTRNTIGWPRSMTPLFSSGMRMTARCAHVILHWFGASSREHRCKMPPPCREVVKPLRNSCEKDPKRYPLVKWRRSSLLARSASIVDAGILFRGAEPTPLGRRAVALLALLVERAGAPVSKEALIEAAWPAQAIEDSNLTVQIAAVRRLFEELGAAAHAGSKRCRGAAIATLVRLSRPTMLSRYPSPPAAPALALPDKPSVAVLPFTNLSGDPEQDYFADGMVDDIITGLARINWLFVIARNSTFAYKGRAVDVKQVGRELGVRYVLEGSVRKAGGSVRITAQMIDASTGAHVWAERYDRSSEDIFALQDEIALIGCRRDCAERAARRNRQGEAQTPR